MVEDPDSRPRLLHDPTTGRPILMSPLRRRRPMLTRGGAESRPCPFCAGNERATPPEVDAQRDAGGWRARAFANKYPASEHHEVVAEGAEHLEHPGELDVATWRAAVVLWQRRIAELERRPGVHSAFLFKNVGATAGASIAHNHSQILGLATPPPRVLLEAEQADRLGSCPWCDTAARAEAEGRLIHASSDHVALVPDPPKLPNETWLLPRRCDDDFLTTDVESLATALQTLFFAVDRALDRPACNFWLHRLPGERFHWHFELQPRTGQVAGLELGGDMYINSYTARTSADLLRTALQS